MNRTTSAGLIGTEPHVGAEQSLVSNANNGGYLRTEPHLGAEQNANNGGYLTLLTMGAIYPKGPPSKDSYQKGRGVRD